MEVQKINISRLHLNTGQIKDVPKNPRFIKDERYQALKKSIADDPEMLDLREIVAYDNDGELVIVMGNMRYRAMKELGFKEAPVKVLPKETKAAKLRAYILKDNISFGQDDWDLLANEWDVEELQDFGLEVLADALSDNADNGGGLDDLPDEENGTSKVRCKRGDVWQLGDHRLMCGDSANLDEVKKLMGGGKADMCFTDPPYGVSIGDKNKALNEVQKAGKCITNIENDTLPAEELFPILVSAMTNTRLSCKEDACYYVTSPQGGDLGMMMMMMMKDAGLPVRHILIWEKSSATFSFGRLDYEYQHEPIFYTWTKKHHNYREGEYRTTIWKYDKPKKCDLHPTMKPVALVENCLKDATKEGDSVVDLFGGSGTTLIACENLKRKCCTMEIDPHYCDVIITRWESLTGKEAIKLQTDDGR